MPRLYVEFFVVAMMIVVQALCAAEGDCATRASEPIIDPLLVRFSCRPVRRDSGNESAECSESPRAC
jgi:hypothetical protein